MHTQYERNSILKMNAFSRLLYLFQTLPISITPTFLKTLKPEFAHFLQVDQKLRVKADILSFPKHRRGMGFPDPALDLQTTHLTRVLDQCKHVGIKSSSPSDSPLATRNQPLNICKPPTDSNNNKGYPKNERYCPFLNQSFFYDANCRKP